MIGLAQLVPKAIELLEPKIGFGDHRHRQNISSLLGAAFVALHRRIPTESEAEALAHEYQPAVERHGEEIERDDAQECLDHLLAYVVERRNLGHWIALVRERLTDTTKPLSDYNVASEVVAMHDLMVQVGGPTEGLLIRNGSPAVERAFADTRWAGMLGRRHCASLTAPSIPRTPCDSAGPGRKRGASEFRCDTSQTNCPATH